jgi:hypothetical protein
VLCATDIAGKGLDFDSAMLLLAFLRMFIGLEVDIAVWKK